MIKFNSTNNLQLEAEGQGLRSFPCPWNPSSSEAGTFQVQMQPSNSMEMEPEPNFLQIGYVMSTTLLRSTQVTFFCLKFIREMWLIN